MSDTRKRRKRSPPNPNHLMKTILGILIAFVTATAAQADVIVYNVTYGFRFIGQGFDTRIRAHGITVGNIETTNGYTVLAFSVEGSKLFTVSDSSNVEQQVFLLRGPSYTVAAAVALVVKGDNTTRGFSFGKWVPLSIRPDKVISRARTITLMSFGITAPPLGETVVAPGQGLMSFSQKATQAANLAGLDALTVINNYRAGLEARGYTESH